MTNEIYIGEIASENNSESKNKVFIINPVKTLADHKFHIKIIMDPGNKISLHKLEEFFYNNSDTVEKALYVGCNLEEFVCSYKQYKNNPTMLKLQYVYDNVAIDEYNNLGSKSKLYLSSTKNVLDIRIAHIKKFSLLVDHYHDFSGLHSSEISEVKTLIDNDLSEGSTNFIDQDGQNMVTKSPQAFSPEINYYDPQKLFIAASKQANNTEILEKKSVTKKIALNDTAKPYDKYSLVIKDRCHITFEICTRK